MSMSVTEPSSDTRTLVSLLRVDTATDIHITVVSSVLVLVQIQYLTIPKKPPISGSHKLPAAIDPEVVSYPHRRYFTGQVLLTVQYKSQNALGSSFWFGTVSAFPALRARQFLVQPRPWTKICHNRSSGGNIHLSLEERGKEKAERVR